MLPEVRLFIVPGAEGLEVQIMTDGVTFEEGVAITRKLEAALQVSIPFFRIEGDVESHRNPDMHHVHLVSSLRHRH